MPPCPAGRPWLSSRTSGCAERWRQSGRLITVADTIDALGRLASYHRSQAAAAVIGVVGSNGKTTTKELTCAVLRGKSRGRTAVTGFNNRIGVPLTLLSVEPADEFVVVEIGTNHPGEVAALAQIARPDVGVVTSIGEEHLEILRRRLKGCRRRTLAAHAYSPPRSRGPERRLPRSPPGPPRQDLTVLSFGLEPGCDLSAGDIQLDGGMQRFKVNGRFPYTLPMIGTHNVSNAAGRHHRRPPLRHEARRNRRRTRDRRVAVDATGDPPPRVRHAHQRCLQRQPVKHEGRPRDSRTGADHRPPRPDPRRHAQNSAITPAAATKNSVTPPDNPAPPSSSPLARSPAPSPTVRQRPPARQSGRTPFRPSKPP